jgi:hypothetical protein
VAIQERPLDCFVAALLAMTVQSGGVHCCFLVSTGSADPQGMKLVVGWSHVVGIEVGRRLGAREPEL